MENKIETNRDNCKNMWKCLKSAINMTDKNGSIDEITINNRVINEKLEMANYLNNYFINSVKDIVNNIETVRNTTNFEFNSATQCKFQEITTEYIINIVKKFENKIGGKKKMSYGVIRDSIEYTGFFYAQIVNESIRTGSVPHEWKRSTIVPIQKVKNTKKPEELRPINTLPSDEKILETVIKNQLVNYLDTNNIIVPIQSGFREKHSCETALNMVIAGWKEDLNQKKGHSISVPRLKTGI